MLLSQQMHAAEMAGPPYELLSAALVGGATELISILLLLLLLPRQINQQISQQIIRSLDD
jgi:hypothetical protein